jgi:hypothetical protein
MYVRFLFVTLYAAKRVLGHEKAVMYCTKLQPRKGYTLHQQGVSEARLSAACNNVL